MTFPEVLRNLLIRVCQASTNMRGEDQTLMVMNKVYVFHTGQDHPNSLLVVIPLIETPDCNYPLIEMINREVHIFCQTKI